MDKIISGPLFVLGGRGKRLSEDHVARVDENLHGVANIPTIHLHMEVCRAIVTSSLYPTARVFP